MMNHQLDLNDNLQRLPNLDMDENQQQKAPHFSFHERH